MVRIGAYFKPVIFTVVCIAVQTNVALNTFRAATTISQYMTPVLCKFNRIYSEPVVCKNPGSLCRPWRHLRLSHVPWATPDTGLTRGRGGHYHSRQV